MIRVENLSKSYGSKKVLKSVTLDIAGRGIHGILGPNGCGKTTLIKSMLGLVAIEEGEIFFDKLAMQGQRQKISWLPQHPKAPSNTTPKQLFDLIEGLRGEKAIFKNELISSFEFENELDKSISSLSGGNYQKTFLILTLMFDVPLIILDEPTVGLDPMSAAHFKKVILNRAEKSTILLISHITSEVEQLSDQIHFLLDGKFVFSGTKVELMARVQSHTLDVSFEDALIWIVKDKKNHQEKAQKDKI